MGTVLAVCTSPQKGTLKTGVEQATLRADWGLEGDAHAGRWHRQVSLLSAEKIEAFRAKGVQVPWGAFGENLVVSGLDLRSLPVGTLLRCGGALLELSQIGKACHTSCAIRRQTGDCIMPREGVFARVLEGGTVRVGDVIAVEPRKEPFPWQAAVITLSDKGSRERTTAAPPSLRVCRTRATP